MQGTPTGKLDMTFIEGIRVARVIQIYVKVQFVECATTHHGSIDSKLSETTNSLEQRSEKFVRLQLVKKFNEYYEKRKFITAFKKKKPPHILILSQNNLFHDPNHPNS